MKNTEFTELKFSPCRRCGDESYEKLGGYGHCVECSYSFEADEPYEDYERPVPNWALQAFREGLMDRAEIIRSRPIF